MMHKLAFIEAMIAEDSPRGDLFSLVSEASQAKGYMVAKSKGIFAGKAYIEVAAKHYNITLTWQVEDGTAFSKGDKLLLLQGDSHTLMRLERILLNIALHASGIATLTSQYVQAIEGSGVKLLDTRKTRPLLREFEKYAVRCGGGHNHRMSLDDALMIKDTHLGTIKNVTKFIVKARTKIPFTTTIEVECENLAMAQEAMSAGADIVMCDNMSSEEIKEVVRYRNANHANILLEASGNVTLKTIGEIAKTGVDAISSGSIIHQATWPDISMRIERQ